MDANYSLVDSTNIDHDMNETPHPSPRCHQPALLLETEGLKPIQPCNPTHVGDESSPKATKLPLGAIVSPLSPFFNERAKQCALERAKAKAFEEALSLVLPSATRLRSASQASQISETLSAISSTESSSSNKSVATAISSLDETELPTMMPRIAFSDWSKFGISLFTPKLANPNSQLYYHYPNMGPSQESPCYNRPRSKSSVSRRTVSDPLCNTSFRGDTPLDYPSSISRSQQANRSSPLRRATLDRYHTSY